MNRWEEAQPNLKAVVQLSLSLLFPPIVSHGTGFQTGFNSSLLSSFTPWLLSLPVPASCCIRYHGKVKNHSDEFTTIMKVPALFIWFPSIAHWRRWEVMMYSTDTLLLYFSRICFGICTVLFSYYFFSEEFFFFTLTFIQISVRSTSDSGKTNLLHFCLKIYLSF